MALAAACASPKAIEGAPARELASDLTRTKGTGEAEQRRCLFVTNRSGETAALFVDGEHVGWIGPRSSAAYFVGRSAGPATALRATSPAGEWHATTDAPPWECHWLLHPAGQ